MNWKTFYALLSRDGHVARRNLLPMLVQNLLQPLLLTFVFGRILTSSGMMQGAYKNVLLPGIIGDQHGVLGRPGGRDAADLGSSGSRARSRTGCRRPALSGSSQSRK